MANSFNPLRESHQPFIIAMKGHPGTGKSTLARALAKTLGLPLLDKDDIRNCTVPLQPLLPQSQSQPLLNDLSYCTMFAIARTQVHLGLSVILDSPLSNRSRLDEVVALGVKRVIVVECRPGDETEWRRRLEERGREGGGTQGHKPATWEELTRLKEGYNGCDEYDVGDTAEKIVIDTTAVGVTIGDLVTKVVELITSL
jgi:predicted kinase